MNRVSAAALLITVTLATTHALAAWAPSKAPAVPEASGFVLIPKAAVPPTKLTVYKAVFDATRAADKPTQLLPALDMAGSELNALAVSGVPLRNARFVVVFHGPAMSGLLRDNGYRAKFGVANPNLSVISRLKKAGVNLYVCGQNLAFDGVDPGTLTPDVSIASDALIVLMAYQNRGYALLSF
jgi:intracellular sulfur oxidation DsrE/DsrF family protein